MKKRNVSFKILISTALLLLAFIFALTRGQPSRWFLFGMAASWLGDMILSNVKPFGKYITNSFSGGMVSFAFAHLMYIAGIINGIFIIGVSGFAFIISAFVLWILAGSICMKLLSRQRATALEIFGVIYIMLVCLTASLGLGLAVHSTRLWTLAVGGLLFFCSDIIIGLHKFGNIQTTDIVIWGTYAPAQLLLIIGAAMI